MTTSPPSAPVDYGRAYTAKKKEGSVASAFVLPAFDSVGECISLRVLCKPCMPLTYFHSQCNETLMCKSNFPCAPLESEGKKMTQQGHLIPDSQHNISQVHNTTVREGLFHYSFPHSTSDKTAAAGPGEKRPRWKITVEINKAIFRRVSG